jgi:hypothetical protein
MDIVLKSWFWNDPTDLRFLEYLSKNIRFFWSISPKLSDTRLYLQKKSYVHSEKNPERDSSASDTEGVHHHHRRTAKRENIIIDRIVQ